MASHRLLVTALTALALAAGTSRTYADQPSGKDQARLNAWASKLGLNQQQQERIHNLCNQFAERAEPVEEKLWKMTHEEFDQVKGVLTPDQRDKLPGAIKAEMTTECRMLGEKLNLTDAQREKIARIREEYEPKFREVCTQSSETARKKMRELRSEFFADIRSVLSDDQKAKFFGVLRQEFNQWRDPVARHERLEELANQLGLSGEQRSQVQKIHAEYRPRIERLATQFKEICNEEKAAISKELTDEQRTRAQEMWKVIGNFGNRSRD
jgi:Spy/CpxP family protein refolding chaperone